MQTHRILSLGSILLMLLLPVMGWFLVAQPQLAAAATADQQRAEIEGQIASSAAIVAQLKADSAKLPELNDELNDLRGSIPADIDPSGYIDGLGALAGRTGVSITGLTVGDPVAYTPATPPVPEGAPAATDGDGEAADGDAAVAPVVPVDDPAFVTSPLITGENFVAIPVGLEIAGKYPSILKFVHGLQTGDRLFLVSTLSTARDQGSSDVNATIGGFIYAIPTGVEGHPRPVSTIVKSMEPAEDAEDTADGTGNGETPDPSSTETPDPGATDTPEG